MLQIYSTFLEFKAAYLLLDVYDTELSIVLS